MTTGRIELPTSDEAVHPGSGTGWNPFPAINRVIPGMHEVYHFPYVVSECPGPLPVGRLPVLTNHHQDIPSGLLPAETGLAHPQPT